MAKHKLIDDTDLPETPEVPETPDNPDPPIEEPPVPTPKPITRSILYSIKKLLGISEEYLAFDIDIISAINAAFFTLNQLGIGPEYPYTIDSAEPTWSDFLGDQEKFLGSITTYVFLKVKLMFDPPTNSFLVDSMQKQIQEYEWRLTVQPTNLGDHNYQKSFKTTHAIKIEPATPIEPTPEEPSEPVTPPAQSTTTLKAKTPKTLFEIFS